MAANRERKAARVLAAVLSLTMVAVPTVASAATDTSKEETVYVVTNANGSQNEVIVSDHLENTLNESSISDYTTLSDVKNVKGDEEYTESEDGTLTWDAEGNDIYYQGTTSEEVPVTMDITYYLDGEKVDASKLEGASGDLEISIDYKNNSNVNGTIVPFVVMTGMMVSDDCMSDISINHGKVIDDGDKEVIVGLAAPGLTEELGISEDDLGFGDNVTIEAKVTDLEMQDMMTIVINALGEDTDLGDFANLDYDEQIDALESGAKALKDGSETLYEGLSTLYEATPELADGVEQLSDGADQVADGASQVNDGASQVDSGAKQVADGASDVADGAAQVDEGASELYDGTVQLSGTLKSSMKQISESVKEAASGAATINSGLNTLKTSVDEQLIPGVKKVDGGLSDVYANLKTNEKSAYNLSSKAANASSAAKGYSDQATSDATSAAQSAGTAAKELSNNLAALKALVESGDLSEDAYNAIADAASQAKSASESATSAATNAGTASAYSDGANQAAAGAATVADKVSESLDGEGENDLKSGTESIEAGLQQISNSLDNDDSESTLIKGSSALATGLTTLSNSIDEKTGEEGALTKALESLTGGSKELSDGTSELSSGASDLSNGASSLKDGTSSLKDGTSSLSSGAQELADGMDSLESKSGTLISGIKKLFDGSGELSSGMSELYEEGIEKIVDLYNNDLKGALSEADNLVAAGSAYNNFSGISTGMDGNVKFIYKTTIY